jgi:hypothetical protein
MPTIIHGDLALDITDIRIFCQTGFKYHPPYSVMDRRPNAQTIARALGLDTRTVKGRMKAMEREGFIKYYQVIPNYSALGYSSCTYLLPFRDPSTKKIPYPR